MAKAQFAQESNRQVQRHSQHNIGTDGNQLSLKGAARQSCSGQNLNDYIKGNDDAKGDDIAFGRLFHIFQS